MDKEQLERIRTSYDSTVDFFKRGIDPLAEVPKKFKKSRAFKSFLKESDPFVTGSSNPDIKEFLHPEPGQKCLDVGCCANLATKRFDKWPSIYYGIDISPILIDEMKKFAIEAEIRIGGLKTAEMRSIPFPDEYFDLAMVIGVFEYVSMDYAAESLCELHRVSKPGAKVVLDLPNLSHPHVKTMFQLEEYLNRPNIPKPREEFEAALIPLFSILKTNDRHVMLKYFVERR